MSKRDSSNDDGSQSLSLSALINTIIIAGLEVASLAGARLVLVLIALAMGAGAGFVGLLAAMFTLFPTLFSIPFARWVDRRGAWFPMIFASLLAVAAGGLFLVVETTWILIPVAGLIGASAFFTSTVASRSVGNAANDSNRTQLIGYLVLGYSLFGFVGPLSMSAAYEHFGRLAPMWVVIGFALLSLALLGGTCHFYSRPTKPQPRPTGRTLDLLKRRELRRWVAINAVFATAQTLFPLVISLHTVALQISPFYAGVILSGFALGMTLARLGIGLAVTYLAAETLILMGLAVAAVMYAAIPFTTSAALLVVCSTLLGLPLGMALPLSLSLIYQNAPADRITESVGLSYTVTGSFQTLAPLVLGLAAGIAGTQVIALTIALLLTVAAIVSLQPTLKKRED